MGSLAAYGALAIFVIAGAIVAYAAISVWGPLAKRAGGLWHLDLMFLLVGPVGVTANALATADTFSGASTFDAVARVVKYAAVALSAWGLLSSLANSRPASGSRLLLVATVLFYGTLVASAVFGYLPDFPEAYWTTPLFVLAFAVDGRCTSEWLVRRFRWTLRAILVITVGSAVALPSLSWLSDSSRHLFGDERLQGLTGHPNALAFIAVAGLLLEIQGRSRWPWRIGYLATIGLAQSSTAFIALLVCSAVLAMSMKKYRPLLALGALIAVVFFALSPDTIGSAIQDELPRDAGTLTGRTEIWAAAMKGFSFNQIFGYGPTLLDDNFRWIYLPSFDAAAQAHNQFVQTLAGQGVVGIIGLGFLLLIIFRYAIMTRVQNDYLGLAMLALLVLTCVTETPLRPAGPAAYSLFFAVLLALLARCFEERRKAALVPNSDVVTSRVPAMRA